MTFTIRKNGCGKTQVSSRRANKRCANHLPEHIGKSFQNELVNLIDELARKEGGFKNVYLQSELLTKYCGEGTATPDERISAAIAKWLLIEARNMRTNMRIQLGDADFGWTTSDRVLQRARKYIAQVLSVLDYPRVFWGSSHTNGASTRVRRSVIAAASKCTGIAHVSQTAKPHWTRVVLNTQLEDQTVEQYETSVLFTVPKNADIDRVACKEPEINMFLQRAVGSHIRSRLKKFGINLNDQTINQGLARSAVRLGLATLDLSAASDSITKQLVFELLPFEWWSLLDDIRVKEVRLPDGTIHHLEMFSSMGNGFTFELESLLFWALTRAVAAEVGVKGRISVFGDDIICPNELAPPLIQIFFWLGFKVNAKKSYWRGEFRESCGGHYYRDWDVSPFYIWEPVKKKTDVIRLLNRLLEWNGRGFGFLIDPEVASFHYKWSQVIPQALWGGIDCESIGSLVTGHLPRKRLIYRQKQIDRPEDGALLHWFTVAEASGASRLSYDLDPDWSYPGVAMTHSNENNPFEVDSNLQGAYFIGDQPSYSSKAGVSYGERTTWSPYLIYGESHSATS
jgi:hypothetical protein